MNNPQSWVSLTSGIIEQAVADLDLAISPCKAKRKPDWAFTAEHFREFFEVAEQLFRVCGFRLNPQAVKDRLAKKLSKLDYLEMKAQTKCQKKT